MNMKGMLFRPEMIAAITEGRKTVTRRIMKPQPFMSNGLIRWQPRKGVDINLTDHADLSLPFAKYHVGETAYIKEAWRVCDARTWENPLFVGLEYKTGEYSLDETKHQNRYFQLDHKLKDGSFAWRSPFLMPAWAARYFVQITDVRPERLQAIQGNYRECVAEGFDLNTMAYWDRAWYWYIDLWDSINKKYAYATNPHVWRIEFEQVPQPA